MPGYSPINLCESCRWMREIVSGKGSRFILCEKATTDDRFRKYPALPVQRCSGHTAVDSSTGEQLSGEANS